MEEIEDFTQQSPLKEVTIITLLDHKFKPERNIIVLSP